MDVAAFDGKTGLPGVHEGAPQRATRGDLQVGIVQHDHRILATKLQHYGQKPACSRLAYPLSSRHFP